MNPNFPIILGYTAHTFQYPYLSCPSWQEEQMVLFLRKFISAFSNFIVHFMALYALPYRISSTRAGKMHSHHHNLSIIRKVNSQDPHFSDPVLTARWTSLLCIGRVLDQIVLNILSHHHKRVRALIKSHQLNNSTAVDTTTMMPSWYTGTETIIL